MTGKLPKIMALTLFALFVAAASISLAAGSQAYRQMESDSSGIRYMRVANGAISNIVRSLDSYASLEVGQGPEGRSLVLMEPTGDGVFENRIYASNGFVCLEVAPAGEPYDPEGATHLMESSVFSFSIDGDLVKVSTDEGESMISVRSGIAGETGGATVEEIESLPAGAIESATETSEDVDASIGSAGSAGSAGSTASRSGSSGTSAASTQGGGSIG